MTTPAPHSAQAPVTTSVSLRGPTILAVLGISVIQLVSISVPEIRFICYLMPFLVLTARAKEPTQRASTVYFLFFLSGLSSITIDAFSLRDILADSTDSNQDAVEILLASLPSFVASALIPLALGVASFVILSAGASDNTPKDLSIFEKLSQWWATTDAPAEINHAVHQAISTIADLNERCLNLEHQTTKNSQQFQQLGTAVDECGAAISQFKNLAVELQSELKRLRKDLRGATGAPTSKEHSRFDTAQSQRIKDFVASEKFEIPITVVAVNDYFDPEFGEFLQTIAATSGGCFIGL